MTTDQKSTVKEPIPSELLDHIRSGRHFLLTSHANPDGDAIGTETALARVLRQMGKEVTIWNLDLTPTVYRRLPDVERIHVGTEPPAGFPDAYDRILLLECPSIDRTGLEDQLVQGSCLLNVDHHLGNTHYGVVNWVDTAAPSVGEMVWRLAHALDHSIDTETATALYLTLVTDTGNFRFSNATTIAFEAAAEMVAAGASPETVSKWLYESQPLGMIRLLGELLGTLETHHEDRIATVALTPEMYERAGATRQDSEGLIDYPRSIDGVEIVALFRLLEDGKIKVSLRSRGQTSVESVARRHSGGGHRNAAGCSFEGPLEKARATLVAELAELL